MSLQPTFPDEIPDQTRMVGEAILGETDMCRFLGEHVEAFLSEADFAAMYADVGRGAVHPLILSMVTIFQFVEKLPDRQASRQMVRRIDWKYATRQELTWEGFHYSDLCNFRKRLLAHDAATLVFDKLLVFLQEKGFVKGRGKQRTDATHMLGLVQRLSHLELRWEALRMALVDLSSADARWVVEHVDADLHTSYAASRRSYRLSQAELKRLEAQVRVDMDRLLSCLHEQGRADWPDMPHVRLLRQVAQQDPDCVDPQNIPDWADSVPDWDGGPLQSPHDPQARYSEKRNQGWIGYKVHLTETVAEEQANFITDATVTSATEPDNFTLPDIQESLEARDLTPKQQYVDRGYMSGGQIARSQQRGIDLRGRVQANASRKPDGFQLKDFDIDLDAQQATCPAGNTSVRWSAVNGTKNVAWRAFFGNQCRACPFFRQDACTTQAAGRRLDISAHHDTLQRRRAEQQTDAFKQDMKQRAAVEGTISEAVRGHGLRQCRYRGLAKTQLQVSFTAVAMNLKRLMVANARLQHAAMAAFHPFFNKIPWGVRRPCVTPIAEPPRHRSCGGVRGGSIAIDPYTYHVRRAATAHREDQYVKYGARR